MKKIIFLIIVILINIGCGNSSPTPSEEQNTTTLVKMSDANQSSNELSQRKIIRSGTINFETNDLKVSYNSIVSLVKNNSSIIVEDSKETYFDREEYRLFLKIPAQKFDDFLYALEQLMGEAQNKSITTQDISENYIDLETRMNSKKKLEQRYLELLNQAKNINEILEIERELNNIRVEIESNEAILRIYDNQIAYSTLNITIYQIKSEQSSDSWGKKFIDSFSRGWNNFIWFFVGLFSFWPFLILFIIIFVIIKRLKRSKKIKKEN